jgi:Ankyrin repeats (many copies)/Ankyrin repeat
MLAAANLYPGERTLTPLLTALRMWQMQKRDANEPLNALRLRDSAGYTALHYAAGCGNADGIAALLHCERALVQQQRQQQQQQYRGGYLNGYNLGNRYSSPVRTTGSVTAAIAAVAADVSGSTSASTGSKTVVNLTDSPVLTAASSGSQRSDRDSSSDDTAAAVAAAAATAALAVAAAAEAEESAAAAVAELPWPTEPSMQALVNIAASKAENSVTALHLAAVDGHVDAVKALLERGTSPHRADAARWTPIYYAAAVPTKSTSGSSSSSKRAASSSGSSTAVATAAANKEAVVLELFKVEPGKQLQDLGRALSFEETRANTYVASVMRCIAALPDFYDQVSHVE